CARACAVCGEASSRRSRGRRKKQSLVSSGNSRSIGGGRPRLMCQIAGPVYLPVVVLTSRGRGLITSLDCVLLRHVFALPRRAVKTRAFPVVNPCLGVHPHLAMASAGCGWVGRFLGRASCRRWAYGRTRCWLRLGLLWSGLLLGRSRW